MLLIGLGSHSVFEGLAVGIEKWPAKTLLFAISIALHKGAAGLSLGISLNNTFPGERGFVSLIILIFALMSPTGIAVGMALEGTSDIIEIVFSCLSAGTFIYIACSEVIVEEFAIATFKHLKLLFFALGIALITSLHWLEPADDDDG